MRAILVDDEHLALLQLGKMLTNIQGVDVIGSYMDPEQAIEAAGGLQPDVAFLDIHMPGISGLTAAERLQEACPDIEIVFITAYDEYAIQAFELSAMDYVLKPLQKDRLARTVQRLHQYAGGKKAPEEAPVLIRCLQSLQIEVPGAGTEASRWRTAKAQELFAYLLHNRGQVVRKEALFELLWPELELRKATTLLYTTIYQVRQDLKRMGVAIEIRSVSMKDGYVLDAGATRIDVEEWEREISRLEPISAANANDHLRLMEAYTGDYLADCGYLWAENERQRLHMMWLQHAQRLGEYYDRHHRLSEAVNVYHRLQLKNPYLEDSYFSLMKLYDRLQEQTAVEDQYRRLIRVLEEEMDAAPNETIQQWYDRWRPLHQRSRE
ncbi:response regulator [Paenibacillus sp. NPDC056579]|uniref:response regulator n=1 Tax=Paenibacillus sp. NPDC056579 TaxID=3345871 RepID=UPI00367644DB